MDNNVREHEARVSAGLSLFNEHLSGTWSSEYILSVTSAFKSTGTTLATVQNYIGSLAWSPANTFTVFAPKSVEIETI